MADTIKGKIITLAEAYGILGLHPNTLRKWGIEGYLKAICYSTRKDCLYKESIVLKLLNQK